jgi:hypothetical protein
MTPWMFDLMLDWLSQLLLGCLDALLGAITDVLLLTPDVTALPQVQALAGRSVWIVDVVFVLVFLSAGLLMVISGDSERARYTIKDLLPRCVVGFVAAHFSQLIAGQLIALANAVTGALTGDGLDQTRAVQAIRADLDAARDVTGGLLFVVCLVMIVFLFAGAAFSLIVRFTLALVLTAGAPIALAFHALPQTDGIARAWWRAFLGVLAVPTCQGFVLFAAQWMLLDPGALLPQLGLPASEPGGVLNLFVVVVLLWLTVRVPALLHRYAGPGARAASRTGTMLRLIAVQQLARGVRAVLG